MKWTYEEIVIQCDNLRKRALSKNLKPKRYYISENMVKTLEEANEECKKVHGFYIDILPFSMFDLPIIQTKSTNIIDLISE